MNQVLGGYFRAAMAFLAEGRRMRKKAAHSFLDVGEGGKHGGEGPRDYLSRGYYRIRWRQ